MEVIPAKNGLVVERSPSFRGQRRVYQTDYFTEYRPGDSRLTGLRFFFLGKAEAVLKLGIWFRFHDLELSTSDSILGLWSLF